MRSPLRVMRGLPVRVAGAFLPAEGPLAVFLPCENRRGASLLRIYNVARALRGRGWRTLVLAPNLTLLQRHGVLSRLMPDVLVMQGARHPLNRPALYPEVPIFYDMDDADFHLPHLAEPVERAMREVTAVIAGSRYIAEWCRGRGAKAEVVWTGSPVSPRLRKPQAGRPPVVAWAQTTPESYSAEAEWVLEVMRRVTRRHPDVRLRLYDRRGEEGAAFLARFNKEGIRTEWLGTMRYGEYLASFDDVSLGLAPLCEASPFIRGKSFGKVLAYLDRKVPVIASDRCEHDRFFGARTGVVSNDPDVWVDAISGLLADARARQVLADAAHVQFRERLSTEEATRRIDLILRQKLP